MLRPCGGASFSARRQDLPFALAKKVTLQKGNPANKATVIASRQDGLY
jgi:hypothetical protein